MYLGDVAPAVGREVALLDLRGEHVFQRESEKILSGAL